MLRNHSSTFESLQNLTLSYSFDIPSSLPADIGVFLPSLTYWACDGCNLTGSLPAGGRSCEACKPGWLSNLSCTDGSAHDLSCKFCWPARLTGLGPWLEGCVLSACLAPLAAACTPAWQLQCWTVCGCMR